MRGVFPSHESTFRTSGQLGQKLTRPKEEKNPMVHEPLTIQNEPKSQIEINIGSEKFIIVHAYTGTRTVQEVYEDFLKRQLKYS